MNDDTYLSDADKRKLIIDEVNDFWQEIKDKISESIENLKGHLGNSDAINLLEYSHHILNRIVTELNETRYIQNEDEYTHSQLITGLKTVFNNLLDSFILENGIETDEEKIDALCNSLICCVNYLKYQKNRSSRGTRITIPDALNNIFNNTLDNNGERNLRRIERDLIRNRDFIYQSYSTVTRLLRFLSNLERHTRDRPHRRRPTDWITGEKSFGNLHTVSSLFILTTYGYIEILNIWIEFLS